jgi:hypothetical protein
MITRLAMVAAAAATFALPAFAEEVIVKDRPDVVVHPGVTVGSGPVVREKEVIREREPRDKVIIKEHHDEPRVEKKTIIHDHD